MEYFTTLELWLLFGSAYVAVIGLLFAVLVSINSPKEI